MFREKMHFSQKLTSADYLGFFDQKKDFVKAKK